MYYKSKQLAKALLELYQAQPDKEGELSQNLINFCRKKNLLSQLPNIVKHLELGYTKLAKTQKCFIKTGQDLSDQAIESIKKYIKIPAEVDTRIEKDKSIQGGFVASYKGIAYDGSIKRQLEKLRSSLKTN